MSATAILSLIQTGLGIALKLSSLATTERAKYERLSAQIKTFIEEGRDPTPEEWADLFTDGDLATARIRRAVEEKRKLQPRPLPE